MSEFEDIDGTDGPEVLKSLASCRVPWDKDVTYFFADLEMHMELLTIKSAWYKRIVLANNLPDTVKPEVRHLLKKTKTQAGSTIYKELKTKIIELFGRKEEELFEEACQLILKNKPSALVKELAERLCDCDPPLHGCCSSRTVSALWR